MEAINMFRVRNPEDAKRVHHDLIFFAALGQPADDFLGYPDWCGDNWVDTHSYFRRLGDTIILCNEDCLGSIAYGLEQGHPEIHSRRVPDFGAYGFDRVWCGGEARWATPIHRWEHFQAQATPRSA